MAYDGAKALFPGGLIPSTEAITDHVKAAGLRIVDDLAFGEHYAEMLRLWRGRFSDRAAVLGHLGRRSPCGGQRSGSEASTAATPLAGQASGLEQRPLPDRRPCANGQLSTCAPGAAGEVSQLGWRAPAAMSLTRSAAR